MTRIFKVGFCHWPECPWCLSISAGRNIRCEKTGKIVYDLTVEQYRAIAVDGLLPPPDACPLEKE